MDERYRISFRRHFTYFALFSCIALTVLILNDPANKKTIFLKYNQELSAIRSWFNQPRDYFSLDDVNNQLLADYQEIHSRYIRLQQFVRERGFDTLLMDTEVASVSAFVVNSTVYKRNNFLTIDKGSLYNIKNDQAVVVKDFLVGKVFHVDENQSIVIPLINPDLKISAKVQHSNYNLGILEWSGQDIRYIYLQDIPYHQSLEKGDTVVTTGFSSTIPEGLKIGLIDEIESSQDNFTKALKVRLLIDFERINYVSVIKSLQK